MAEQVVTIGDFTEPLRRAIVTSDGALTVTSVSGSTVETELPAAAALSDATANPTAPMVGAAGMLFNGTNWNRHTNNLELTVLASAARTATNNSSDMSNFNCRGAHIVINVTAAVDTPSVTFAVQGKCPVSAAYYTILTSAAITGTGTTALTVYPGVGETANIKESDVLPRTWRVAATHADADSITYSVSATLVV